MREYERWQQSGSVILAPGNAWVCIMAEPHHKERAQPVAISSPHWDEAMERARLIAVAPVLFGVCDRLDRWFRGEIEDCPNRELFDILREIRAES